MAKGAEIVMLCWQDLVGLVRGRAVPLSVYKSKRDLGLGWAVAGDAIHPFSDIVDNPWGSMVESRQIPVPETETRVDLWDDAPPLHFVLCDALNPDGSDWECSPRGFLKAALAEFEAETGLTMLSTFEQEFHLTGAGGEALGNPGSSFGLEMLRAGEPFAGMAVAALEAAGVPLEAFEPEYGLWQYEMSIQPRPGLAGPDQGVIAREVVREAARRLGLRASFSPKPAPDAVGNGVHVHFSFRDKKGRPAAFDPAAEGEVSAIAGKFAAGVLRHMKALVAVTAPSPVSYMRLGPHKWSCGYNAFGLANREAAIRVCPSPEREAAKRGEAFNLEYRASDGTANLYLTLGMILRAGLAGIKDDLPRPPFVEGEPDDLPEAERAGLGLERLPESLEAALAALEADTVARSWFTPSMFEVFGNLKRFEIELAAATDPAVLCDKYRMVY